MSAARYHADSGRSHPIDARPMTRCLAGESATMIAGDYRPVEVVHAFEYLPELGGGCIMAHVDYAEAMQPVVTLRNRAISVAVGFGAFALLLAWVLGWLISKPLRALADYAGTIAAGHFDEPPRSVRGSREITSLSQALGSMAKSLEATLLLEQERVARIEAERGEHRMRLLADTSAALSASLEQERALGRVASLATDALGASCFIHLRGEDGTIRLIGAPERPTESPELERAIDDHAAGAPVSFGKPFVCIPLSSPRFELGVLVFAREGDDARDFVESEVELMRELGRRIVMALENERLYREVRDAVALRDSFISIASHELRTPLTALQLRLRSLRGGRAARPEALERALDSVDRQVARLDELIESLLDVSRISSGRMNLELADVDMASIVREACGRFRDALAQADCPLTLEASGKVVGRWDALRLDQIVTNLLSNAIKYGPGAPIEVRVEGDEQEGRLIVTDHGIGIPEEARTRVFERFGRAVRERRYSGLGLGLWIVREIVAALHGRIELSSARTSVEIRELGGDLVGPSLGEDREHRPRVLTERHGRPRRHRAVQQELPPRGAGLLHDRRERGGVGQREGQQVLEAGGLLLDLARDRGDARLVLGEEVGEERGDLRRGFLGEPLGRRARSRPRGLVDRGEVRTQSAWLRHPCAASILEARERDEVLDRARGIGGRPRVDHQLSRVAGLGSLLGLEPQPRRLDRRIEQLPR